jgi:acetyl esterase
MPTRRAFLQGAAATAAWIGVAPLIGRDEVLGKASAAQTVAYDPRSSYPVDAIDIEFSRGNGDPMAARVYQPRGAGIFPAMIFAHGGAWTVGDHTAGPELNEFIAASGMVILSPDFRNGSPSTPHPVAVQDINFATRWFKAHAREFNASAQFMGGMGSSSGGHLIALSAMSPADAQYNAIPLPEATDLDASLAYLVQCWPILDPYGRFMYAHETGNDRLVEATRVYFNPWEAVWTANPTAMLERGEAVQRPPSLILQGTNDDNVTPALQRRFEDVYRSGGGQVQLELFEDQPHGFANGPGPYTDQARAMMKDFIATQLASQATTAG